MPIWPTGTLCVAVLVVLVSPVAAFGAEPEPVAAWVSRGIAAALDSSVHARTRTEALRYPRILSHRLPSTDREIFAGAALVSLNDPNPELKLAAVEALEALKPEDKDGAIAKALLETLKSADRRMKASAARALGGLTSAGKNAAIAKALLATLNDRKGDGDVKSAAIEALGALKPEDKDGAIAKALLEILRDSEYDLHSTAAKTVAALKPADKDGAIAAALLDHVLNKPDPTRSAAAAQALGTWKPEDKNGVIEKALLQFLRRGVMDAAGEALAAWKPADEDGVFANTLLEYLRSPDRDVRYSAARALVVWKPKDRDGAIAKTLLGYVKNPDSGMQDVAVQALSLWKPEDKDGAIAQAVLESLRAPNDVRTRLAAAKLVRALKPEDNNGAIAKALLEFFNGPIEAKYLAAEALRAWKPADKDGAIARALLGLFNDPNSGLRRSAVARILAAWNLEDKGGAIATVLLESLKDTESSVKSAAADALRLWKPDDKAGAIAEALREALKDPHHTVRSSAAEALRELKPEDPDGSIARALLELLKETRHKTWLMDESFSAGWALWEMNPKDKDGAIVSELLFSQITLEPQSRDLATVWLAVWRAPPPLSAFARFLDEVALRAWEAPRHHAAFLVFSGGRKDILPLARLVAGAPGHASFGNNFDRIETLHAFTQLWPHAANYTNVKRLIAQQTVEILDSACSVASTVPAEMRLRSPTFVTLMRDSVAVLVNSLPRSCLAGEMSGLATKFRDHFIAAGLNEGNSLKRLLEAEARADAVGHYGSLAVEVLLGHALVWILLLTLYPHSTTVQAIFFWNPWVRRYLGLHLAWLIPLIPFARRRLLAPFRAQLGPPSGAGLIDSVALNWFPDSEVIDAATSARMPMAQALRAIRGLTILEGESGLGKTVYLLRLARAPHRITAFIRAAECGGDVLKAIRARLPAEVVRDESFLRSLIHAGGLDICIDGLNEVSAEARASVTSFAQEMTQANILISTQRIRWMEPAGARILQLQPLRPDQTESFLLSREPSLPVNTPARGDGFRKHVRTFLDKLDATTPVNEEERIARRRALSNPMDLTTIALILARRGEPNLLNLVHTAFEQAAEQYAKDNQNAEFPLAAFAEHVYERRCQALGGDRELIELDDAKFAGACDALADHRLMLRFEVAQDGKTRTVWRFRHDKILDFFLYVAMTARDRQAERVPKHLGDPRFRGVYLLIALQASLENATRLREILADEAAETKDHVLSDEVWSIVRQRLDATQVQHESKRELVEAVN